MLDGIAGFVSQYGAVLVVLMSSLLSVLIADASGLANRDGYDSHDSGWAA